MAGRLSPYMIGIVTFLSNHNLLRRVPFAPFVGERNRTTFTALMPLPFFTPDFD